MVNTLDRKNFGAALRALRSAQNLTQESLAADAGMSAPNLSLLESGQRQPNLERIVRLADALNTQPSELLRLAEADAQGKLSVEVTVRTG